MLNKIKKMFACVAIAASVASVGVSVNTGKVHASVSNYDAQKLNLDVKGAIAIDASTGQVLYAKNANQKRSIASMTKLITVYLTLQAIKQGKLSWDEKVSPTSAIAKVSRNSEYSNVPLYAGHSYTVRQLYQATLIESANGAAMTLAKAVSGNQVSFVKKMRSLVKSWGIKDAKIYNSCGLANGNIGKEGYPGVSKNTENELSASDMAIITQKLLKDFPEVLNTTSVTTMTFKDSTGNTTMNNWNWMLKGLSAYYSDLPVDGLKTGTTDKAGACFSGTVSKNGHRIITIVLGAKHANASDPSRFVQTAKLMHYVYNNYTPVTLKKGTSISGANSVNVPDGKSTTSKVVLGKTITLWTLKNSQIKTSLTKTNVSAPITKNQKVSSYKFSTTSGKLMSVTDKSFNKVSAVATKDNGRVNIFVRIWRSLFGSK